MVQKYQDMIQKFQSCDRRMEISIATFNVHMWVDADYNPNYDRVLALVKVRIDIQMVNMSTYFLTKSMDIKTITFHLICIYLTYRSTTQMFYVFKNVEEIIMLN